MHGWMVRQTDRHILCHKTVFEMGSNNSIKCCVKLEVTARLHCVMKQDV